MWPFDIAKKRRQRQEQERAAAENRAKEAAERRRENEHNARMDALYTSARSKYARAVQAQPAWPAFAGGQVDPVSPLHQASTWSAPADDSRHCSAASSDSHASSSYSCSSDSGSSSSSSD